MNSLNFFIISGTSGSGKTIALQVLEDLGFYCIDNLPASLLADMASRTLHNNEKGNSANNRNYAVSIDSRNQDFIGDLKENISNLSALNVDFQVLFLDADDSTLLNRYSETRRKHPLTDKHTSLSEAITKERHLLQPIAEIADRHINTSKTTPHELRSLVRNYAAITSEGSLTLLFQSFGFKYGSPDDADFVFDVRCLPNPHWNPELKPLTGLDKPVQQFLSEQAMCNDMYERVRDFIEHWLPEFSKENRNYITVAVGCTGGQHRSVYLCQRLADYFLQNQTIQTLVRHREINI
jgi:UPF0042 nucleotide-binding protein